MVGAKETPATEEAIFVIIPNVDRNYDNPGNSAYGTLLSLLYLIYVTDPETFNTRRVISMIGYTFRRLFELYLEVYETVIDAFEQDRALWRKLAFAIWCLVMSIFLFPLLFFLAITDYIAGN